MNEDSEAVEKRVVTSLLAPESTQDVRESRPRILRVFSTHPLLSRLLTLVVAPILIAVTGSIFYLRGSLPTDENTARVVTLDRGISLTRDDHGVVSIKASRDADVFFALGVAQAQDRLWQLELQRRIAGGRLSEVFGRATIHEDVWMRTLGLYTSARESWAALSPDAQVSLTSFADGVNAWLNSHPVLPPEFIALGISPEPWTPLDSLAWAKVFALTLSGNVWNEFTNSAASQMLKPQQMKEILNVSVDDQQLLGKASSSGLRQVARIAYLHSGFFDVARIGGSVVGSNGWVISPSLTEDGNAILANDTHQPLQQPSPWYVASLRGDKLDVAGMMLVGLPIVMFGHNAHIVWGGTAMRADVQDLLLEQQRPNHPDEYLSHGTWKRLESRTELINVKADFPALLREKIEPLRLMVRRSENGVIVSDVLDGIRSLVALKWTTLEGPDRSYESFFRANYAQDRHQFDEAFRFYVAPTLNMIFADDQKNIGSIGIGAIPIRSRGDGQMPAPAWTGEYRWTGVIPYDSMPRKLNPEEGFIVSANTKIVADDYPYFISNDWAPLDRFNRINQLLKEAVRSHCKLTVSDMMMMQGDEMDLGASRLRQYLKGLEFEGERRRRAVDAVARWDGSMAADSNGAAVFFVWAKYLREIVFGERIAVNWNDPYLAGEWNRIVLGTSYDQILFALNKSPNDWCDSTGDRSCATLARRALDKALAELTKLEGGDMEAWRWGKIHSTVYHHRPFSALGVLAQLFERRIPNGGSSDTVNMASAEYKEGVGYEQTIGPGFRQIMQIGIGGTFGHYFMNSTGQSGNPLSEHYDDMITAFRDVEYLRMPAVQPPGPHPPGRSGGS
jgi:penicillin G amidase